MHPYASDDLGRKFVPLGLITSSAGLAILTSMCLKASSVTQPWWIEVPSIVTWYGVLWAVFNKWVWKTRLMKVLRAVDTTNLSGKWMAEIASSHDGYKDSLKAEMEITQTWNRISICLASEKSRSTSYAASLVHDGPDMVLLYHFRNSPKVDAVETMAAHSGIAELRILNAQTMEGEYSTGRGRSTLGRIIMLRQEKKKGTLSVGSVGDVHLHGS